MIKYDQRIERSLAKFHFKRHRDLALYILLFSVSIIACSLDSTSSSLNMLSASPSKVGPFEVANTTVTMKDRIRERNLDLEIDIAKP